MKKTLAALAVLGAFAGTSLAADVTLYGIVDMGVGYKNVKKTDSKSTDTFGLESGQNSASRFGLKGTEDLGNGLTVGFLLENSFKADAGTLGTDGSLFDRESQLFVKGGFGQIGVGRYGALDSTTGSYGLMGSAATPMGGGWNKMGDSGKIFLGSTSRIDNAITYVSPTFAGVTLYAQASLKKDNAGKDAGVDTKDDAKAGQEGSSDANRYYALGAKFAAAGLNAGLVVAQTDYSRQFLAARDGKDDALTVTANVNYDFGFVKPMLAVQYFDNGVARTSYFQAETAVTGKKGYGIIAGATAPVVGGTLKAVVGWNDSKGVLTETQQAANAHKTDYNDLMFAVGYEYPLSKRTTVYGGAGYLDQKTKDTKTTHTKTTQAMAGVIHKF